MAKPGEGIAIQCELVGLKNLKISNKNYKNIHADMNIKWRGKKWII